MVGGMCEATQPVEQSSQGLFQGLILGDVQLPFLEQESLLTLSNGGLFTLGSIQQFT